MASSDGDSASVIVSTLAESNLGDHRLETHTTDVSTDSNGDGSTTVSWDESFKNGTVFAFATLQSDEGDNVALAVTSTGADQCTVTVGSAATTSGTVTVNVLAVGKDRRKP